MLMNIFIGNAAGKPSSFRLLFFISHFSFQIIRMFSLDETIIARATPRGASGRGILRLSGDDSIKILRDIFHSEKEICDKNGPRIFSGTLTPWQTQQRSIPCDLYVWSLLHNILQKKLFL